MHSLYPCIGFFDSGQGGLTLWEAVRSRWPNLNTLYLGDNARYPYGNKSPETLIRYTKEAIAHLHYHGAEMVIVACGTASSVAVQHVQNNYVFPVHGIVEGFCEQAFRALASAQGAIGILGTRFTVESGRFFDVLRRLGAQQVWSKACPLFVPIVEEGVVQGNIAESVVDMYLNDIPSDIQVLMLACTHFPRLAKVIARYLAERFQRPVKLHSVHGDLCLAGNAFNADNAIILLDSSPAIVSNIERFIQQHAQQSELFRGEHMIHCTDSPKTFERVARYFVNFDLPATEHIELISLPYEQA